ncbi:cytochrome P450 [Nitriliruptor alkaliphilus]|uniref:cytochrome P450 n=1 Tax=Nitriliruptor alkaliphilus TaxID=427918 RepID=UPI000695C02D|nr:cytochrome P450 [Nitriliruptor alkaliphilus]
MATVAPAPTTSVPQASAVDTARVVSKVLVPLTGRGLIVRRPPIVQVAERLDLDRAAVQELQRLRDRYGPGPVLLKLPIRDTALVLEPGHVHRILAGSPVPFRADSTEKRAALAHFQPEGALASSPEDRPQRRRFNERVLDTPSPIHQLGDALVATVREEAAELVAIADRTGRLTWDDFITGWWRTVRRVVFGAGAREDHPLTDMLGQLRAHANWSRLRPKDEQLRERFLDAIRDHLTRAEPGSLASLIDQVPAGPDTDPAQQVPQWLFAYDPGGIAAIRALALLAAHPDELRRVRDEMAGLDLDRPQELPRIRAAVLDGLRLWPTTPGVLRETTEPTTWESGTLDAGTSLVIFAPFFHRDDTRLAYADRFAPELWLGEPSLDRWPLIPFSDGPVVCPGQNLVLLTTSTMVAALLEQLDVELEPADRLRDDQRMPSVLSPFDLAFTTRRRTT